MKPLTEETGRVWKEQQQMLRGTLERMIRRNRLSKLDIIADEIGMGRDELYSKISINPRTPLTRAEMVQIEYFIKERDSEEYENYLRSWHANDGICVR